MQLTLVIDTQVADDLAHAATIIHALNGNAVPATAAAAPVTAESVPAAAPETTEQKRGRGRPRKEETVADTTPAVSQPPAVQEPETPTPQPEVAEAVQEPVQEAAPAPSADDFEEPVKPAAPAAKVTLDDLRAQVRGLMSADSANKAAISGVLKKHGADLLPDLEKVGANLAAVMADLKAI